MDGAHGGSGRPARFATAMKRNLLIGMCLVLAANIGAQPPDTIQAGKGIDPRTRHVVRRHRRMAVR